MYYDPELDVHHRVPARSAMATAFYLAPQVPEEAKRLFEAACASARLDRDLTGPLPVGRGPAAALILAREWGWTDLESRLVTAMDEAWEPTWDVDRGEFTWGLGLGETHPRGQFNAFLAAAEAGGAGRWQDAADRVLEPCPQIVDVDFPDVALTRAEWVDDCLHLRLAPRVENPQRRTMFRLIGAEPRIWYITGIDGVTMDMAGSAVVLRSPMVHGDIVLTPGSY